MSKINIGKFSEALNDKADLDLNNTTVFSTLGEASKTFRINTIRCRC